MSVHNICGVRSCWAFIDVTEPRLDREERAGERR